MVKLLHSSKPLCNRILEAKENRNRNRKETTNYYCDYNYCNC